MKKERVPHNGESWLKSQQPFSVGGRRLEFDVPHDVFSTLRIDEGTILLLENLPDGKPKKILDLGCGYGALGLSIAALFPNSFIKLVDRDLLAVEWARRNARKNLCENVFVKGSLGFEGVDDSDFDWILCNIPARIGKPFMAHFFREGLKRLNSGGSLRVVVIRDLVPLIKEIGIEIDVTITEVAVGARHSVLSVPAPELGAKIGDDEIRDLYLRDHVDFSGMMFDRPFDLGGDDPRRLSCSLPLLVDALPRQDIPKRVLCVRSGYGILPILCKKKWPDSEIHGFDRDLLALSYTRRNSARLLEVGEIILTEGWFFPQVFPMRSQFDLITLEVIPSAGKAVAYEELASAITLIQEPGLVLGICPDKIWREWFQSRMEPLPFLVRSIAARDGFTVFSVKSQG